MNNTNASQKPIISPNIDSEKARDALAFHREIEDAVKKHREIEEYKNNSYKIIPIVGIQQPTLQSQGERI